MKNKTSLLLMEQLIMVLVFALSAALCLTAFVKADRISRETAQRDEAVLIAQNAAQVLKATSGGVKQASATAAASDYQLEIQRIGADGPLGQAEIRVWQAEKLIFTLRTGWQEVTQ